MSDHNSQKNQTRRAFVTGLGAAAATAVVLKPAVASADCIGAVEVLEEGGYFYTTLTLTDSQREALATQTPNGVITNTIRVRVQEDTSLAGPLGGSPLSDEDPWPTGT